MLNKDGKIENLEHELKASRGLLSYEDTSRTQKVKVDHGEHSWFLGPSMGLSERKRPFSFLFQCSKGTHTHNLAGWNCLPFFNHDIMVWKAIMTSFTIHYFMLYLYELIIYIYIYLLLLLFFP